ncbi:MAG: CarD family transcriptional regulator [Acutalibacteraceae bacterium]
MYNIDEQVVYSMIGVCRITDITQQSFGKETKKYYVLKPVNAENNTIYVPYDGSSARIQPLLTAEEAKNIIAAVNNSDDTPFVFDKDECMSIIKSGDRKKTLRILRELNKSRKQAAAEKRKFHIAEENVLNAAKKLLCDEFSYVLNVTPDQALKMML